MDSPDADLVRLGTLVRDSGGFVLEADDGTRYRLQLPRVPVDLVQKRVRVAGMLAGEKEIVAEGVSAA